ncbi:MAG: hypothetical protein JWN01_771 [Patescibacteria group bacterium]|jgi:hypothetical protein|nr:hypothetical protein [Patescibacteria group bacterium]
MSKGQDKKKAVKKPKTKEKKVKLPKLPTQ